MVLKKVVREKIVEYFEGDGWQSIMSALARGHDDVLHAHIYLDSILHPSSVLDVAQLYFEKQGLPLGRKVPILSHGHGRTIVYYIQPGEMCHFEFFLRFNQDVVLEPMPGAAARSGKEFEYWDRAHMARYYSQFTFAKMGPADEEEVRDFYRGPAWDELCYQMGYQNDVNGHAHCIVDTKYHPEDLMRLGLEAIKERGWSVDRSVSVVFSFAGLEKGKITFLLKKPEIVLELEWNNNPNVGINPARNPVTRQITFPGVRRDIEGIPYRVLDADDLNWLAKNLPATR